MPVRNRGAFGIATEGWKITGISCAVGIALAAIPWAPARVAGGIAFLLMGFNLFFFRDPERNAPAGDTIACPADGRVILVKNVTEHEFMQGDVTMVSIFMNVFNVHVNRAPIAGEVVATKHTDGLFLAADKSAAPDENERHAVLFRSPAGLPVLAVQVAGLIARRIVPFVSTGDAVEKGSRYGLICYGSRVDVYLPRTVEVAVRVGDRTVAGETVLGVIRHA